MKNLTATEMPLHKIFSDDYLFTIPAVQRPYSWTTEEAGDLISDLVEYIERNGITEENINTVEEPYFLGSLVLIKKAERHHDVLDGQQRLTTLTILLSALREYLENDSIKLLITQEGNRLIQTQDEMRLTLRTRDQPFFEKYIQMEKGIRILNEDTECKTDSQRLIRDNALYFLEEFNNLDPNILKALPSVIASKCYMVVVSTYNFDSAFRIFTVLNDRGLDLKESDIFKAKAIGEIPQSEQEAYTMKWEEIEMALGRENFNKLFDHIRMIIQKRKGDVNVKEEYEKIFETINGKEFIDGILIPYGEIFMNLIDYHTQYQQNPEMLKLLDLLSRIDNVDWIPPAMLYIYQKKPNAEGFLKRLEAFAASAMILRRNFNWRMTKYAAILREIVQEQDMFAATSTLTIDVVEQKNIIEALNGDVYTDLKASARRYVLLRLDSILSSGQPYYNHSIITIEHVLPQNPMKDSEWLKVFNHPEEYVHKLGNLVLLTSRKNSQARNFDFEKKKNSYFQSSKGVTSFALTTQVIQEDKWTPEVIQNRQQKLIELLKDDWAFEV